MGSLITPNENDVVSGRGSGANRHKGNLHFRQLIKDNKGYYLSLSKNLKMGVAREIFDKIASLSPPGRFLQKNPETDTWFQVRKDRALEKISQALREKPHAKKMEHAQLQQVMAPNRSLNLSVPEAPSYGQKMGYNSHPQQTQQQQQQQQQQQIIQLHQTQQHHPNQVQVVQQGVPLQNVMSMGVADGPLPVRVMHQSPTYQQPFSNAPQSYDMRGGNQMYNPNQHHQRQMQPQYQQQRNNVVMFGQNHQQQPNRYQHRQYPQPNQQMQQQQFVQNQPYTNVNTVPVMTVQDSMNSQVMYAPSQSQAIPSGHMMPAPQVYTEMPSIPEVPREYLVDSGSVFRKTNANPPQKHEVYVNAPTSASRHNPNSFSRSSNEDTTRKHVLHGSDVTPASDMLLTTPLKLPAIVNTDEPKMWRAPIKTPQTHKVGLPDFQVSPDDDADSRIKETVSLDSADASGKKRTRSFSDSDDDSYDAKRHRRQSEENNNFEKDVALSIPSLPKKRDLVLRTNAVEEGPKPLVSPQNDDDKSLSAGKDEKNSKGSDTEVGNITRPRSGLNTLSTAASLMSKQ